MIWLAVSLAFWLGWAALIDARQQILPDFLTLPLMPAGLLLAWLQPPGLAARIMGLLAGYLAFAGTAWAYRRLRGRDGLGLGDAKLLGAAGAWVGWQGLPSVVLLGAIGGLVWALAARLPADRTLPFGPFLAAAFWLVWYFGPLGWEN